MTSERAEAVDGRERTELAPGASQAPENTPEGRTEGTSGLPEASEAARLPSDREAEIRKHLADTTNWSLGNLAARDLLAEVDRLRAQLALATVLEIPRSGTMPLQLRRSYGHTDRWAICDRTGRRWHREYGWVVQDDGIRYEADRDDSRYTLAEALPLAERLATEAGER